MKIIKVFMWFTKTPTRAGGIVRERAVTVRIAISAEVALVAHLEPGVTMLGFKRHPSQKMLLSERALTTTARTLSVTYWLTSMECSPSTRISGSIMGTSPLA